MAKLLLIDDDPLLSRMYHDKFKEDGFTVEHASDGEEGIKKLASFHPDLVLLDMMMPKMDGLAVLKKLKEEKDSKHIPVIMLSNVSSSEEDTKKALELGAVTFLVKSNYTPKEVVEKVKEILHATVHETPKAKVHMKE